MCDQTNSENQDRFQWKAAVTYAICMMGVVALTFACHFVVQNSHRLELNMVAKIDIEKEIYNSNRPVFFVAETTSGNSTELKNLFERLAYEYPEVYFVRVEAAEFQITPEQLPAMGTIAPALSRKPISLYYNVYADGQSLEITARGRIETVLQIHRLNTEFNSLRAQSKTKIAELNKLKLNRVESQSAERAALYTQIMAPLIRCNAILDELELTLSAERSITFTNYSSRDFSAHPN